MWGGGARTGPDSIRGVVEGGKASPHQSTGDVRCGSSSGRLSPSVSRTIGSS